MRPALAVTVVPFRGRIGILKFVHRGFRTNGATWHFSGQLRMVLVLCRALICLEQPLDQCAGSVSVKSF
jgi:hypothetical protein